MQVIQSVARYAGNTVCGTIMYYTYAAHGMIQQGERKTTDFVSDEDGIVS